MYIAALTKTTLLDYPEHVAATVFTGGCNFRCPWCHNGEFTGRTDEDPIPEEEVLGFLKKRAGILEGVCITGGEPTLQRDLPDFTEKVRALGYLVKLDTNGTDPEMLSDLINRGLVDYVAMDLKNTWEKYAETAGLIPDGAEPLIRRVKESVRILLEGKIPYEFRTTVVKGFHTREDLHQMAALIEGAPRYFIQSYRDSENVLCRERCSAFTAEELKEMISGINGPEVSLRGVD